MGGHIYSLLLREGNPNSRLPPPHPPPTPHPTHTHSPTLPRSAAGPGTRAAGRSPRAELECWLFITDVLVLFLPVLQNTQSRMSRRKNNNDDKHASHEVCIKAFQNRLQKLYNYKLIYFFINSTALDNEVSTRISANKRSSRFSQICFWDIFLLAVVNFKLRHSQTKIHPDTYCNTLQ